MTHTAASKILSLLLEDTITNTQHYRSLQLLQLQAIHHHDYIVCQGETSGFSHLGYHLEYFSDWHGFVMLQVMAALGPALDLRFYPSHRDWETASEYDCLLLAYGRGAALRTMSYLGTIGTLKISMPGSNELISANEYFADVLLKQAVLLVEAFDAVRAQKTPHFSMLGYQDRPHLLRMLREALNHFPKLASDFDLHLGRLKPHRAGASVMTVPLPPSDARVVRISRMTCTRPKAKHNSEPLIRSGLTPTLHPTLRRYHHEVVVVKKEQKERSLSLPRQ
jgi:hypothetical protein